MTGNFYHTPSGTHLGLGQAFELDGVLYPDNWLQLASDDDLADRGFVRVTVVGERKDEDLCDHKEVLEGPTVTITATLKPIEHLRALWLTNINKKAQEVANLLTSGYPEFEKATWPDQQREALAWDADHSAPTPYLDQLAGFRGIDRVLYIQKTLAKVNAFRSAAAYLAGTRQKYEDHVKAASTLEQLQDIQPVFTLPV